MERRIAGNVQAASGGGMSTDTPRTDSRYVRGFDALRITNDEEQWVRADFARQLERELAAETEKVKVLREALDGLLVSMTLPPEMNCSCHIAPPCSDCVNYPCEREAIASASATLEATK